MHDTIKTKVKNIIHQYARDAHFLIEVLH